MRLKTLALRCFMASGLGLPFSFLLAGKVSIFMLHRFRVDDPGVEGLDPAVLRRSLEYLRRRSYELLDLGEAFLRLAGEGEPLRGAIVFTIDDGYFDQVAVGGPIFAEFDCPVTVFLTTGFVDGKTWQWWDRTEFIFDRAPRTDVTVEIGGTPTRYRWTHDSERRSAREDFIGRCKVVPDAARLTAIGHLAAACEVDVPHEAPPEYAATTWAKAREWERKGMSFGPHTMTHPILSRTSDEAARAEIEGSWRRLQEELREPVPVFGFPNGMGGDFGDREAAYLEDLGFLGAVAAYNGYADSTLFRAGRPSRFSVPRWSMPQDVAHLYQYVTGLERMKQILRREQRPRKGACEVGGGA